MTIVSEIYRQTWGRRQLRPERHDGVGRWRRWRGHRRWILARVGLICGRPMVPLLRRIQVNSFGRGDWPDQIWVGYNSILLIDGNNLLNEEIKWFYKICFTFLSEIVNKPQNYMNLTYFNQRVFWLLFQQILTLERRFSNKVKLLFIWLMWKLNWLSHGPPPVVWWPSLAAIRSREPIALKKRTCWLTFLKQTFSQSCFQSFTL